MDQDKITGSSSQLPGFITKTFSIFNTIEFLDCCGWGNEGTTIIIKNMEQFAKTVLPKFFKHSNITSFVRQLNMVFY
jgi:heat shock transcription factor